MYSFDEIIDQARTAIDQATTDAEKAQVKLKFFGRNGTLNAVRQNLDLQSLPPDERKSFGLAYNSARSTLEGIFKDAEARSHSAMARADAVSFDPTIPARSSRLGSLHPIIAMQIEVEDIFRGMGFQVMSGNEAVSEFENFDALNIPGDHPARDMQDTFWLENGAVLRTHTSAMQHRAMRELGVPLRAIFPGRCYRNEAIDLTHENTFYQLEGMVVGRGISVSNLIAVMKELLDKVFDRDTKVRLRPGYFPFVEPGFELDFWTRIGNTDRWLELMPCGMIHRNVLELAGVDPDQYSGFAFGLGLTRLAMLKFGIPDVRLFNKGDLRFSAQFAYTL